MSAARSRPLGKAMRNGRLIFDDKFAKRTQSEQLEYLQKLCAAQNQALEIMQKERDEWRDKALKLEQNVQNAETAFYAQKEIVTNLITQKNEEDQKIAQRIHILEDRIKAQDKTIRTLNGDLN